MPQIRYININSNSLDTPIYRIIPFDYLVDMLIHSQLVLVKPKLWDDPFEEFLSKQKLIGPNGENYTLKNFGNNFFSQCWTMDFESDFMWRVYSPNNRGVKIKSTLKIICDEILKHLDESHFLQIGKVDYWNDKKIRENFENPLFLSKLMFEGYYHSLLIKKESFRHENEVRIIHTPKDVNSKNKDIIKLKVDPNVLIQSIQLHPKLSDELRPDMINTIRKLGFNNEVINSDLFSVPELKLTMNWKK
jgi:hypothetical protein